LLMCC